MKTLFRIQMLGLFALLSGSYRMSAQFTLLTDNRSVGVYISTNGYSVFQQTDYPSVPFAPFDTNVMGQASDGPIASCGASSSETSIVTTNAIFVTNRVDLAYSFGGAPTSGSIIAEETCEIIFSVQTPIACKITGVEDVSGLITPQYAALNFYPSGVPITTAPTSDRNWTYLGVLQPGTYELNANLRLGASTESPDADLFSVSTGFSLIALPIPQITSVFVSPYFFEAEVSTAPGSTNVVLFATNPAVPMSQWQPIPIPFFPTNVANTNGVFSFGDYIPGQNTRFYRISMY